MRAVATSDVRAPLRIRRYVLALTALLTFAVVLALAPRADAYVYWADRGTDSIAGAYLDGTGVNRSFVRTPAGVRAEGVAVDATHIYWANHGANTVGRANRDGTGVNQSFITGVDRPVGVEVGARHVYWTTLGNTIGRANRNGTGANNRFITGANNPIGVEVTPRYVLWANNGGDSIGRASLNGTGVNQNFITGADGPQGLATHTADVGGEVDVYTVYWANNGGNSIGRATDDGTGVNQNFIRDAGAGTGARGVGGLAVNANHIYWGNGPPTNSIGRALLNGTRVDRSFITGVQPAGLAVGAPDQTACARARTIRDAMVDRYRLATRVASRAVRSFRAAVRAYRRSSDPGVRRSARNHAQRASSHYFMAQRVARNAASRYFEQRRILRLC